MHACFFCMTFHKRGRLQSLCRQQFLWQKPGIDCQGECSVLCPLYVFSIFASSLSRQVLGVF